MSRTNVRGGMGIGERLKEFRTSQKCSKNDFAKIVNIWPKEYWK